ncbi:hypothetical protein VTK26DRAFT_5234 [Humicola hyalothermophila]
MLANRAPQHLETDGLAVDPRFHHHHHQHQHQHHNHAQFPQQQLPSQPSRKRKADAAPENNERLSKRMSLLNLEQSGQKLYVPVENALSGSSGKPKTTHRRKPPAPEDDNLMHLDDTKHKVYIYNLDDELSSDDTEPEDSAGGGRLVFLPDIEKHLRTNRIPTHVLRPPELDADSAVGKELVLYQVPSSITVPEEQDSVRKAIMEARARARERQRAERGREREQEQEQARQLGGGLGVVPTEAGGSGAETPMSMEDDADAMELD